MKKAVILMFFAAVILATVAIFLMNTSHETDDNIVYESDTSSYYVIIDGIEVDGEEYMFMLGVAEATDLSKSVYARGVNVTIYTDDVMRKMLAEQVIDAEYTEQEAFETILRKEVFISKAYSEGIVITDEQVEKYINTQRTLTETSDEYCLFEAYIHGLGISEDEYWESVFEQVRDDLAYAEFYSAMYSEYLSEIDYSTPIDYKKIFETEILEVLIDQLIEEENLIKF